MTSQIKVFPLIPVDVESHSLGGGLPFPPPRIRRKPRRLLRCSLPFKRFAMGNHRPSPHDGNASKQNTSPGGIWLPCPSLGLLRDAESTSPSGWSGCGPRPPSAWPECPGSQPSPRSAGNTAIPGWSLGHTLWEAPSFSRGSGCCRVNAFL